MKRKLIREKQKSRINSLKKRFREGGRTEVDLEALREVQSQFDALIKDMASAKLLLASLTIGYDEAFYHEDETIEISD
jgi:DNA invertase Pin-like site-specific DNA recombinase